MSQHLLEVPPTDEWYSADEEMYELESYLQLMSSMKDEAPDEQQKSYYQGQIEYCYARINKLRQEIEEQKDKKFNNKHRCGDCLTVVGQQYAHICINPLKTFLWHFWMMKTYGHWSNESINRDMMKGLPQKRSLKRALFGWMRFWKTHDLCWADRTVFMTRYTLIKFKSWSLKIHRFRRDDETAHDHPWRFFSLILWRSYLEEVPEVMSTLDRKQFSQPVKIIKRRWLSFATHPPHHIHRVIVEKGKDCWTLCLTVGRAREWGFWVEDEAGNVSWIHQEDHGDLTGRHRVSY
jgi:hypothetical protein